jgi:hypothetical protein
MARKAYKVIRLEADVVESLKELQRDMMRRHFLGQAPLPAEQVDGVTMSYVVSTLIAAGDAHRARAKKQRQGPSRSSRAFGAPEDQQAPPA